MFEITNENQGFWVSTMFVILVLGIAAMIYASTLDDNDPINAAIAAGWTPEEVKCVFRNKGTELERSINCGNLETKNK